MNGLLLEALYAKYHADKTDAVSKLEVLKSLDVDQADKIIEQYTAAQSKLKSLNSIIAQLEGTKLITARQQLND
jgi:hypothetical protein